MKKSNCGASMKPQQKNTPKLAMGGMMQGKGKGQGMMEQKRGNAPVSIQAKTAVAETPMMRRKRKQMGM